jgi:prepilin-type N-terminal cleavage/methylation domain-containing protein
MSHHKGSHHIPSRQRVYAPGHVRQRGFTLIETLAAIVVLTIGLVGMAALMSNMMTNSARSRYMSEAAMLASEKLEDLERYPAAATDVAVASGSLAGSLSGDVTATVTSNGSTENVDYFDEIQLSSAGGTISETSPGKDTAGNTTYTTVSHAPDGTVTNTTSTSSPPLGQTR